MPDYTPGMKYASSVMFFTCLTLACALVAACGNKGPLVHPDQAEEAAADS